MTKKDLARKILGILTRFEVVVNDMGDIPWEETHEYVLRKIGMDEKEFRKIVEVSR